MLKGFSITQVLQSFGITVLTNSIGIGTAAPSYALSAIPILPGAVEILRFGPDVFFSGFASSASTVYITPGQGL